MGGSEAQFVQLWCNSANAMPEVTDFFSIAAMQLTWWATMSMACSAHNHG